uniref:NADH-quinone oxidoreductase subunit H n=1 Tax=Thermofilum pendens TaxID=2269 RepID=A0A7C3WLL3_THEPE
MIEQSLFWSVIAALAWLAYAVAAALLLAGLRRKLRARLQGRVGPPIWQPVLDLVKLMYKKPTVPESSSPAFLAAPAVALASSALAAVLVPAAPDHQLSFTGDLVLLPVLLFAGEAALVFGGFFSGNPYAWISASRSLNIALSREAFLVLALISLYIRSEKLALAQAIGGIPPPHALLLFAFFTIFLLFSSFTTLFSAPLAETEILEGYLLEYSGPLLALAELSHWLMSYTVAGIASAAALSALGLWKLGVLAPLLHLSVIVLLAFLLACIDAIFARLRIWGTVKLVVITLGILSFTCLVVGVVRWWL